MKTRFVLFVFALGSVLAPVLMWAQQNPVIAQDSEFEVKLTTPLSTETSKVGDTVTAQVLSPEQFAGKAGQPNFVEGKVKKVVTGNKSGIQLFFDTLQYNGKAIPIEASIKSIVNSKGKEGVDEEGNIIQKKTIDPKQVAHSAGLGALSGGLSGGGKGAAKGAAAGAVAEVLFIEFLAKAPKSSFAPGSQFTLVAKQNEHEQ